ncbi:twin-arginine translocation pathway signal [Phlyctema vagabunda]|uniref:Twin-arginine translocation pathway signal n=1 Tax=Phlyctema vagabunda TaxID=108571 RepID=A0ABR4PXD2_9HELO
MPSIRQITGVVMGLAVVASTLPAQPKLNARAVRLYDVHRRQNPATGLPDGLTDIDVLQFALTAEHLETAFYQQGFAKFPDSDFTALGLNDQQLKDLKSIGGTEATHVITLNSAIAGAGTQPVQPCTYNFGFTTAAAMVATAGVLENIGVSAYIGAAPLVKTPAILTVAAEIVTVEARHQTFIRTASKAAAIPSAFDTPLGIRSVFTLAAGFISSCPEGSNLAITPFAAITQTSPAADQPITAGSQLALTTTATGATACAFTNGGLPGGTAFTPFTNGGCAVPQNLAGVTYLNLATESPTSGALTDAITVAGPLVLPIS